MLNKTAFKMTILFLNFFCLIGCTQKEVMPSKTINVNRPLIVSGYNLDKIMESNFQEISQYINSPIESDQTYGFVWITKKELLSEICTVSVLVQLPILSKSELFPTNEKAQVCTPAVCAVDYYFDISTGANKKQLDYINNAVLFPIRNSTEKQNIQLLIANNFEKYTTTNKELYVIYNFPIVTMKKSFILISREAKQPILHIRYLFSTMEHIWF